MDKGNLKEPTFDKKKCMQTKRLISSYPIVFSGWLQYHGVESTMKIYNISMLPDNAKESAIHSAYVSDVAEGVCIKACTCRPCSTGEFKLLP